jgi:hypothetical protein
MPDKALDFNERRQAVLSEREGLSVVLADVDQTLTTLQNVLKARLNQVIGNRWIVDVDSVRVYNELVENLNVLKSRTTEFEKLDNAYTTVLHDIFGGSEAIHSASDDKPKPPLPDDQNKGGSPPPSAGKNNDVPPAGEKTGSADLDGLSAGARRVLEGIVATKQYKELGGPARLIALITSTALASRWFTSIELCKHVRALDPQFFAKNNDIFFALNGATSNQTKFFDKKPATKEDREELKSSRAQFLYRLNDDGKAHVKEFWSKQTKKTKKENE